MHTKFWTTLPTSHSDTQVVSWRRLRVSLKMQEVQTEGWSSRQVLQGKLHEFWRVRELEMVSMMKGVELEIS